MPLIKPRTRGKQLVKHRTRLDCENNETLSAYAHFLAAAFFRSRRRATTLDGPPPNLVSVRYVQPLQARTAEEDS
jgi:hypothetical protein